MPSRILLTGASGFIGAPTLAALLANGAEVTALSRHRPAVEGAFHWLPCDLLDAASVETAVGALEIDMVLHLAWNVEHGAFWTSEHNLAWVEASLRLFRAARRAGACRIVGVGTCYEYDWPADALCDEWATPTRPQTLYGASKDAVHRVLEHYAAREGLSYAWGRVFFLQGPGEGPGRLTPSVARSALTGTAARISSGVVVRDFMDVRDAGEALARLALSEVIGPVNIATGQGHTVRQVAEMIVAITGRPDLLAIGALTDRPGEPPMIVGDTKRLNLEVGYTARRSLTESLSDAVAYWRKELG